MKQYFSGFGIGVRVKHDHEQLVSDALEIFKKAEDQMANAIEQINDDIEDEQKAIREAQARISASEQSMGKLSRVLDRLKALTE